MTRPRLTAFSWGYYGWGNAADRFVAAVDRLEAERGFQKPIFVDTRLQRSVRAKKFNGSAFEQIIGTRRHHWMNKLGNRSVGDGGRGIRIYDPSEVERLLDEIETASEENRRLIFFCGCRYATDGQQTTCHRRAIAKLLLRAAEQRRRLLTVVEWPGERPQHLSWTARPEELKAVQAGRLSLTVGRRLLSSELAGLAPFSTVELARDGEQLSKIIETPFYRHEEWQLRLGTVKASASADLKTKAAKLWHRYGFEPLKI